MDNVFARNWGWLALRGVIAILFGALTLTNPAISLAALVFLFGGFAIADGVFTIASAIVDRRGEPHWGSLLVSGILSLCIGVATFVMPGLTAMVLLFLIAAWAIVTGIARIATAIRLRKVISGEWVLVLVGLLSIVLGVLLIAFPGAGALAVVTWIGAYAVVIGILEIVLAFRLRKWSHEHGAGTAAHAV